jgi:hypothetical protein
VKLEREVFILPVKFHIPDAWAVRGQPMTLTTTARESDTTASAVIAAERRRNLFIFFSISITKKEL